MMQEGPSATTDCYNTAGNAFLIMNQIIQIVAELRKVDKSTWGIRELKIVKIACQGQV